MTVAMLERQHKFAAVFVVHKRRSPPRPWARHTPALVAMLCIPAVFAGKRHTTGVTDQPCNERRVPPTRTAKAKIAFDMATAQSAARRIDHLKCRLKSRHTRPIVPAMTQTLTDRSALIRNRRRALRAPVWFLHETAADEIEDRLSLVKKSFTSPALVSGFPEFWQNRFPETLCVGDGDTLALAPEAHDLVIHALCLHWANDPVGQLIQARRALKPDGLMLTALFGGETLHELRTALAQAESDLLGGLSPRVLPMGEIRDLGALLQRAGFALPVADTLPLKTSYASPAHLMRELRAMGESNAMTNRPRRATRRALFDRAAEIYAHEFGDADGRIPATFEMIFLTGWSPDVSQPQPLRPGSASARLADVLGAKETPLKD